MDAKALPQEKPISAKLYYMSRSGKTLSNREIYIPVTHRENLLRGRASELQHLLIRTLVEDKVLDEMLLDSEWKIRVAYTDPRHYGDNGPDRYFSNGTLSFPNATFSYFDLFCFALSGHSPPYKGFAQEIGLDDRLSYESFCALIGLLDVDAAILALDEHDYPRAGATLLDAWQTWDEMRSGKLFASLSEQARTQHQKHAAKNRYGKLQPIKEAIISEWKTGRFGGNKSECARWAIKQFEIAHETVKTWLREYEKSQGDEAKSPVSRLTSGAKTPKAL